jgi:hypothetical protein
VAALRLLQREEEQRQVREQPPDLPPLPDLQGREFFLLSCDFHSLPQLRRPTTNHRRPLSVAGWVHPVPEMQGLQVHHISREQRLVITGGRHSRLASKIELETDHLVVLLFLLSFLLVVMTAMWIVFRHYSKLCAFTSSPLSMNVLLAWSSGKHI